MSNARLTRSERALVGFGTVVPLLALGTVLWTQGINQVPPLTLPKRELPVPNAHEALTQAAYARVKAVGTADAEKSKAEGPVALQDRIALRRANALAVRQLRVALTQEYYQPQPLAIDTLYPEFAEYRGLARVLAYNSQTAALQGDYPAAAEYALDTIAMGLKIPRGGPLIGDLVGIACEAIGRKALWEVADQLDTKTLRAACTRLEALEAGRVPFAEVLGQEKWGVQAALHTLVARPTELAKQGMGVSPAQLALLFITPKRTILENNAHYFDAMIERSKQPYVSQRPALALPKDPLNQLLLPAFEQADYKDASARTETALLRAYLMVRLYQKEHGALPKTLPVAIPDPLGQNQPLHYRRDSATAFTLYSVGPDGDDDHGRAGVPKDASSTIKDRTRGRYLLAVDEGDLVARVNTY